MTAVTSKRAAVIASLIESGQPPRKVILEHVKTDAAARALNELGLTVYGTRIREACKCWFYERNHWQHDCFLDVPELPLEIAAPLLIHLTFLDGHQGLHEPEPMFLAPEEIETFAKIHPLDIGWTTPMLMARLAEQARWGRASGRKMAMSHGVPGLDPDYVWEGARAEAIACELD
jgi:hypothetical protein